MLPIHVKPEDSEILRGLKPLKEKYYEHFGESFCGFNYETFPGTKDKLPSEQYKEMLEEALLKDEPTRIENKWLKMAERLGYFD